MAGRVQPEPLLAERWPLSGFLTEKTLQRRAGVFEVGTHGFGRFLGVYDRFLGFNGSFVAFSLGLEGLKVEEHDGSGS